MAVYGKGVGPVPPSQAQISLSTTSSRRATSAPDSQQQQQRQLATPWGIPLNGADLSDAAGAASGQVGWEDILMDHALVVLTWALS